MSKLNRVSILRQYIQEEPENPFNYYALALEIKDLNPEEAQALFDFLLKHYPDYLPVYYSSAQFFFELDQLNRARETYEKGIQLAQMQQEEKTLRELRNAYQNFLFETDLE